MEWPAAPANSPSGLGLLSAASAMAGVRALGGAGAQTPAPQASGQASRPVLEHAPASSALRPSFVTLEDLYNLILQLRADVQELQSLLEEPEEGDMSITIPQTGLSRQFTQSATQYAGLSK